MRVLILGGDGYLGWPTAIHLSSQGHEVAVVDNYLRRNLMRDEDVGPLYDVPNMHERVRIWKSISGYSIDEYVGDLNRWDFVSEVFEKSAPDVVIHYAEQPSAPYSMLSRQASTLTIQNNLGVTANTIFAVKEYCPDAHVIKLGTMGEYGTPDIDIEEGWIDILHKGRSDKFLYPRQAGSLYHTTKIMDTDLLWYYVRMWGLRVTDLMQGPVYGIFTHESSKNSKLLPFFSYDEIFGTVLNRFVVQAVAGYPLTVYGEGGQTRGYLNIMDTLNCVRLAMEKPAEKGELRIFNQFTETFTVNELASRIMDIGNRMDLNVKVNKIDNPRLEKEEHYYNPVHTGLVDLGLAPHYLTEDVLADMLEFVLNYKNNIEKHKIFKGVKW